MYVTTMETCLVMHEQIGHILPIKTITLAFSDILCSLATKIHLDLIESSVKAHGYLEVVRIII